MLYKYAKIFINAKIFSNYFTAKIKFMSYFGLNIKKIRAAKKLSQTEFAKIFNLTRAAVGAYEEGRAEAKIDKIIEIAQYFSLTLEQLLTKKLTINEIYHYDKIETQLNISKPYKNNRIPFIKFKKHNEYIKNNNNIFFIEKQPYIELPIHNSKNLRAFEYISDKTDFYNNCILICKKESKANFEQIQSKEYFLVKKQNFSISSFDLRTKSDIIEVWEIIGIYTVDLKKVNISHDKIEILENKIDEIYKILQSKS